MTISRLAFALCVAAALAGCQDVKSAFGGGKLTPDEFAVMPKAPLVMPPDYNLRPPQPGSRAANMPDPSDAARASLYPNNPEVVAQSVGAGFSDGEKLLLAYAHAANADPSIRQRIAAEEGQDEEGGGFADKVLFWQGTAADPTTAPVDAQAEAERLRKAQAAGQPATQNTDTPIRGTSPQ
jgi:microcompartment protein CcmK/EutM